MKKTFLLLLMITTSIILRAQVVQWGARMGNGDYCAALGTVVDAAGNIYTTGYFTGTVDFNPGPGVYNLITTGGYDAYIQKLDANGNFLWAAKMGQTQDDRGERVTLDGAGNVIITGTSNGLFNLGLGRPDIAVWKYNASGVYQWWKKIGNNYYDYATAVTTDAANNIYITGTFENTVDFNPGGAAQILTSTGNLKDMYILKLLSNGDFRWVKQIATATGNPEKAQQIKYNSTNNNIYFAGVYYGKTDFNPGIAIADTFFLNTGNINVKDVFISQMDTAGNFINAVKIGNQTEILFGDFSINPSDGKICITGGFRSVVDFNPGVNTFNMDAGVNVGTAVYCCILNQNLSFNRAFQLQSATPFTNSVGLSVKIDANDNIYLGGRLEGTVDLAPDAPVVNYTSVGGQDMFLVKISPANHFIYGGATGTATDQFVTQLDVNSAGEIYIVGAFNGTLNYNMNGGTYNMTATGLGDAYIAKYAPSFPLPVTWKSFTALLQKNNEVALTWVTSSEQNLSHFEIEKSTDAAHWNKIAVVNAQGNTQTETVYEWLDKENTGITAYYRIKQADINGNFFYSETEKVIRNSTNQISIYPNPCMMTLNVSLPNTELLSTIEVYTADGKKIISAQTNQLNYKLNVNDLTRGTYMLRVFNAEKTFTATFVRQ